MTRLPANNHETYFTKIIDDVRFYLENALEYKYCKCSPQTSVICMHSLELAEYFTNILQKIAHLLTEESERLNNVYPVTVREYQILFIIKKTIMNFNSNPIDPPRKPKKLLLLQERTGNERHQI